MTFKALKKLQHRYFGFGKTLCVFLIENIEHLQSLDELITRLVFNGEEKYLSDSQLIYILSIAVQQRDYCCIP